MWCPVIDTPHTGGILYPACECGVLRQTLARSSPIIVMTFCLHLKTYLFKLAYPPPPTQRPPVDDLEFETGFNLANDFFGCVTELASAEDFDTGSLCIVLYCRYSTHGSILYTVCECGVLRRYRRWPDRHVYLNDALHHKSEIEDFDISPYDECILARAHMGAFKCVHLV